MIYASLTAAGIYGAIAMFIFVALAIDEGAPTWKWVVRMAALAVLWLPLLILGGMIWAFCSLAEFLR